MTIKFIIVTSMLRFITVARNRSCLWIFKRKKKSAKTTKTIIFFNENTFTNNIPHWLEIEWNEATKRPSINWWSDDEKSNKFFFFFILKRQNRQPMDKTNNVFYFLRPNSFIHFESSFVNQEKKKIFWRIKEFVFFLLLIKNRLENCNF